MHLLRSLLQILLIVFDLLVIYFLFAIIGMFWTRNKNEKINQSGIPLIIHGDGFHTELYLPIEDSVIHYNWFMFLQDSTIISRHRENRYINIGWAEEGWSIAGTGNHTNVPLALKAIFWPWNRSIMHVQFMDRVHKLKTPFTERRLLSVDQYKRLVLFIQQGFLVKDGKPVVKTYQGYYGYDYFFSSGRNYNAFNTCNQWTADALHRASVRNPTFAPFGWAIAFQLKKRPFRAEP